MQIRVGFAMGCACPQPTPMILALSIHSSWAADPVQPQHLLTQPAAWLTANRDMFGNWCHRLVAPQSAFIIRSDTVIHDSGLTGRVPPKLTQAPVETPPESTLVYLLGGRYGETDLLSQVAGQHFGAGRGHGPGGWQRVQAICDFVHRHIEFGYRHARRTRSPWKAFNERRGVCRDFTHRAITLCSCMNIPARHCTGYLGDIGLAPEPGPMDFAGWFEAFPGDRWYTFDPRNNTPRVGREGHVLNVRGRDACDVALTNTFGPNTLHSVKVWSDAVFPT
jgi:transglutaminase-like putative cysteine protease